MYRGTRAVSTGLGWEILAQPSNSTLNQSLFWSFVNIAAMALGWCFAKEPQVMPLWQGRDWHGAQRRDGILPLNP